MRGIVWLILLFVIAVVAATALGQNDGLVTVAWGAWRTELSLNFAVLLLLVLGAAVLGAMRALEAFLSLPRRAREWRSRQRERAANAALREALSAYFGGRYSRAQKAARRAIGLHEEFRDLPLGADHRVLAQLVAAGSLHRLQDRAGRDGLLNAIEQEARQGMARSAADGALLLGAEWALDDQDADRALDLLQSLPPGVARRTQALRLKLRAARLAGQTHEALDITRLLAKHQAFSASAASGLLRALALEHLDAARDAEQLRAQWQQLEPADRADTVIVAHAVRKAVAWQASADARRWLEGPWQSLGRMAPDDRTRIALALASATEGAEPEWLERTESAARTWPADPAIALAAGRLCAQRQLWGKARQLLEPAASHPALPPAARRSGWRTLAGIAEHEGNEAEAVRCAIAAASIED